MNSVQKEQLLEYLKEYVACPFTGEGREESYEEFDKKRASSIPEINKLVADFLSGKVSLSDFKDEHGFKCREFPYWGFKGVSGQMQLNQLVKNVVGDDKELVFRKALLVPKTEQEASEKIDSFRAYIEEKRSVRSAETKVLSMPRVGSVAYVLSYFWEIQNKSQWPVCYQSSRRILGELGFATAEYTGQNYIGFVELMNEIANLYKKNVSFSIQNPFWFVEHVLYRRFLKLSPPVIIDQVQDEAKIGSLTQKPKPSNDVANEWLPPIIADLCDLALNKETEWSKRNKLKPDKAFEKKVCFAFTLLGYEAVELGQGKGRGSDGFAISCYLNDANESDYAIIYDAKARDDKFSVGTNDREIYEYIKNPPEELKRRRLRPICFLIISSQFDDSQTNLNRIIDVDSRTNTRIVMISASDLLFVIVEKLRNFELDHARIRQLFVATGILTRQKIVELLGIG